jgi:hypothetical protein
MSIRRKISELTLEETAHAQKFSPAVLGRNFVRRMDEESKSPGVCAACHSR